MDPKTWEGRLDTKGEKIIKDNEDLIGLMSFKTRVSNLLMRYVVGSTAFPL